MFVPCTSFSGFVLSKCQQPSFVFSHLLSWQVRAMEQICQYLHYQPPFSHIGSPNGSLPDLEGTGYRWRFPFSFDCRMCFILPSVVDHPHCMHDHLNTASNKKIWSSRFSFSATSCPIFPPSFCLKLPVLSKNKENKSGGREHEEMMTSLHLRVSRGLSVSQTSQSITRNTLFLPNLA